MYTKGAHHVSLTVTDLGAARGFYGEVLGLPEIERPDFGIPGTWYQAGVVQLHIIGVGEDADIGTLPSTATPIANHIAFEIENYDAMKSRLEEFGYPVMGLGAEVGQLFTRDPHGNMIEFIQPGGQLGRPAAAKG